MSKWSDTEVAKLKGLVAKDFSDDEISKKLGRTVSAVRTKKCRLELDVQGDNSTEEAIQAEQDRQERRRAAEAEREALYDVAGERSLRARLEVLIKDSALRFPPLPAYKSPKQSKKVVTENALQLFSDFHGGELVLSDGVRGINEFNSNVLEKRVRAVVEGHLSIKRKLEAGGGWRLPTLTISLNGDLVSGTIHELERHSDHKSIVDCVYWAGHLIAKAILELSAEYEKTDIFVTAGNHGRLPDARRVQQKDPTRSWDTIVALFAKTALSSNPKITFYIPHSYSVMFDIAGWRFLQQHGHDVKSWNSIPWYGINRLISNIGGIEAARGMAPHYYIFGHFHSMTSMPHANGEAFINGSIIGATEFSVNALGKADRPQQLLLMVHEEHGVTSRWPIYAGAGIGK